MTNAGWKWWAVSGTLLGLSGCFCGSCVARGSRVRTRNGHRRIEELRVGDLVLSFDPLTGDAVEGAVTMIRSATRETMRLRVGDGELRLTTDHPVYCPDEGVYAAAGDWALGRRTRLWQLEDERPVARDVGSVEVDGALREVFDITVDTPHHNFLAEEVLVHNKSPIDRQCELDGELVFEFSTCDCPGGGEGFVSCDSEGGNATCTSCVVRDGGVDAAPAEVDGGSDGSVDAATSDAATSDAATSDAAP